VVCGLSTAWFHALGLVGCVTLADHEELKTEVAALKEAQSHDRQVLLDQDAQLHDVMAQADWLLDYSPICKNRAAARHLIDFCTYSSCDPSALVMALSQLREQVDSYVVLRLKLDVPDELLTSLQADKESRETALVQQRLAASLLTIQQTGEIELLLQRRPAQSTSKLLLLAMPLRKNTSRELALAEQASLAGQLRIRGLKRFVGFRFHESDKPLAIRCADNVKSQMESLDTQYRQYRRKHGEQLESAPSANIMLVLFRLDCLSPLSRSNPPLP